MTDYNPKSSGVIRSQLNDKIESLINNPALDNTDVLGALLEATARTRSETQEEALADLARDADLQTATGEALTLKAAELGVERRPAVPATGVVEFSRSQSAPSDFLIVGGTQVQTAGGSVVFETTESTTINSGTTSATANVEAVRGGADTNLPANTLTTMPSPPVGVDTVTNPEPTGDVDFSDTDGENLIAGRDRETDEQLRERALDSTAIGGAATSGAIRTALLDLEGVRTATLFTNDTQSANGNGFGLPPYSTEVVVSGGNETEIARALRDTVSVTELFRLQGGAVAIDATTDVYVPSSNQTVSVGFSRPNTLQASIALIVGTESSSDYVGNTELKRRIVNHVGGTLPNGATETGLDAGEDLYLDRLKDVIVGPDTGVLGITNLVIDTNGDGSDDTETFANGLTGISVARSEQIRVDAANDITIT